MLVEALTALAAAGGSAVVQAAGTDAWAGFRQAVARWFGRGDAEQERAELERLDKTVTVLRTVDPAQAERARISQEASWQARIETVLETWTRESAAVQPTSCVPCWPNTSPRCG
ncbi:hypothetical protein ACFVFI_31550 [Streptomyces sp. NPDC057705]|uniref:hypothetical protein n=1 Tax=Streptomyces sp. NPDC057705 TaxID=3346222 RepID=UPI0036930B5D